MVRCFAASSYSSFISAHRKARGTRNWANPTDGLLGHRAGVICVLFLYLVFRFSSPHKFTLCQPGTLLPPIDKSLFYGSRCPHSSHSLSPAKLALGKIIHFNHRLWHSSSKLVVGAWLTAALALIGSRLQQLFINFGWNADAHYSGRCSGMLTRWPR